MDQKKNEGDVWWLCEHTHCCGVSASLYQIYNNYTDFYKFVYYIVVLTKNVMSIKKNNRRYTMLFNLGANMHNTKVLSYETIYVIWVYKL